MNEYRIKQDINLSEIVDEYTKRISRVIDEQTLANVENQLAEYGYIKVVRCHDCRFNCIGECTRIDEGFKDYWFAIEPDGFCAWGERGGANERVHLRHRRARRTLADGRGNRAVQGLQILTHLRRQAIPRQ